MQSLQSYLLDYLSYDLQYLSWKLARLVAHICKTVICEFAVEFIDGRKGWGVVPNLLHLPNLPHLPLSGKLFTAHFLEKFGKCDPIFLFFQSIFWRPSKSKCITRCMPFQPQNNHLYHKSSTYGRHKWQIHLCTAGSRQTSIQGWLFTSPIPS